MSAKKTSEGDSGTSRKERRAAERASRKSTTKVSSSPGLGSRLTMPVISGAAIAIGLIVVVVLAAAGGAFGDDAQALSAPEAAPPAEALQVGRSLGDPAAPVKVEVFEDTQCPHCKTYTDRIEPLLIAGPVTSGEVFLTYKDMAILGPESVDAAAAMRVAEELDGKFWEYHGVVFHNQSSGNSGGYSTARLADMAELVGLDREAFLAELEDPAYADAVVAESEEGRTLGVSSTPTIIINGEIAPGVPEWNELSSLIDSAATAAGDAG